MISRIFLKKLSQNYMPCNELIWHRYVNFTCTCNLVVLLTTFVQSSPVLFCIDNTILFFLSNQYQSY